MKALKKFTSLFLALLMIISAGAAMTISSSAEEAWGAEVDGIYYIDDVSDMLSFIEATKSDKFQGKTVKLRADIDMSQNPFMATPIANFCGTLDGCGYAIKGLTINSISSTTAFIGVLQDCTIQNIAFTDANVKSTGDPVGVIAGMVANSVTGDKAIFKNVYVSGVVEGKANVGGFVGRIMGTGRTLEFYNCVSDCAVSSTGNGSAGFLGNIAMNNQAVFNDCAFIGDMSSCANVSAAFVGFGTGNITLVRCVSLGNIRNTGYTGALIFLDHQHTLFASNAIKGYSNIVVIDCYAACREGVNPIGISSGRGFCFNISVRYGGAVVYSHNDEDTAPTTAANGIYGKLSEINAVLVEKKAYMANGSDVYTTAANFSERCTALATSEKWVVTEETVSYNTDKNIVKVVPAGIYSKMLTSPVEAKYLQIRENGDGYDVRFVGTVNFEDLTKYAKVGFDYTVKKGGAQITNGSAETGKVFGSIIANGKTFTAEQLSAKGLNIVEFGTFANGETYEITVTAFAKTADGTVIYDYSGALTVKICDGALVN